MTSEPRFSSGSGGELLIAASVSWWKAKHKTENGQEGEVGLIPATYVEEVGLSIAIAGITI